MEKDCQVPTLDTSEWFSGRGISYWHWELRREGFIETGFGQRGGWGGVVRFFCLYSMETKRLYECLCDVQIIKFSITYKLRETTSVGFPYYYIVTNFQQVRFASNVSSLYRHAFVCDVLRHFPQDDMNCYMQTVSDDRCDRSINCLVYSVQLNSTKCSSRCSFVAATASEEAVNSISTIEESKSSYTSSYTGAGVGAFLLIVATATYSGYRYRKGKLKDSSTASPVTSSSEISASNGSRSLPDNHTSGDGVAAAGYLTLEELDDRTGDAEQAPECDADSYNIIQECVAGHDRWVNTNTRSCRPLPVAPESNGSISRMPSLAATSELSRSLPASLQIKTARPEETDRSLPNIQPWTQSRNRPKPKPNKRQPESNQIKHMGVVNMRGGHPALSAHTQVRLVRNPWGDMELITLESDLPIFTEYYSRLQLLNMKDNGLGVVGVSAGQTDSDSHKYFDFLETQEELSKQ
ncbi:hypothetical protein PoB_003443700 [Plakobranchus ocellatus]|uniref:Uncharacterized protein n=1 Tax=Plakobranchus ocellatus TaxID=259542 RepID=A0AAV4ALX7_9GAST|nr:hypothetical protein PoB_003443700 [Plakobranchus ocellatus]